MLNHNKKPERECVYCGSRKNLTKDHVPPKCLFATPPQNAITVPSCQQCNQKVSMDDEYFRANLAGRRDVGDHPEAQGAMEKAFRALQYPEAERFRRTFLNNIDMFFFVNELGFIEPGASYSPDIKRLERVASRITKGLFWHKTRKCLPDHYVVDAFVADQIQQWDEPVISMCAEVLRGEPISVGNEVFSGWYKSTPEDEFTSLWVLQFYTKIHFLCLTVDANAKPIRGLPA